MGQREEDHHYGSLRKVSRNTVTVFFNTMDQANNVVKFDGFRAKFELWILTRIKSTMTLPRSRRRILVFLCEAQTIARNLTQASNTDNADSHWILWHRIAVDDSGTKVTNAMLSEKSCAQNISASTNEDECDKVQCKNCKRSYCEWSYSRRKIAQKQQNIL